MRRRPFQPWLAPLGVVLLAGCTGRKTGPVQVPWAAGAQARWPIVIAANAVARAPEELPVAAIAPEEFLLPKSVLKK